MTEHYDLIVRGGTVVRPGVTPQLADVAVRDGVIAAVLEPGSAATAADVIDATGLHVLPGSIDPHVHVGLGGGMEEYRTDSGAAALGGVTTQFFMHSTGGSYLPLLEEHLAVAEAESLIDFGFYVTLMTPEHLAELDEIKTRFGLRSYKYYMHFRGDDGKYLGVEGTHDGHMWDIMTAVAERGDMLLVHAENPEVVWSLRDKLQADGRTDLVAWDDARPPFVEAEAVRKVAYFAQETGAHVYLVHTSTANSLAQIRSARAEFPDLKMSVETCPHYLTHTVDFEGGIVGKVNPPLRRPEHRDALWAAIADGTVNTMGSDHVGRKRSSKDGTIWTASAGFPGAATTLPVMITEGHRDRGIPLERIVQLTAAEPARLLNIDDRKGDIVAGLDADLAIIDITATAPADPERLGTWSDYSLYETHELTGWARHTVVRGTVVVRDGAVVAPPGTGEYVRRIEVSA